MSGRRVDYDRIASTYDRRFASGEWSDTAAALIALARELGAERVLEVGCGTGRWLLDLPAVADQLHGLDLSVGMLLQARQKDGRLRLTQGRAGRLPYAKASFDLVYSVNAVHHFEQPSEFVAEARRLLRPDGALAVVGMDPHGHRNSYYLYHYFHGTYETDVDRFPSWDTLRDWMTDVGFEPVSGRIVERIVDPKVGRAVLEDPFLAKDATSQLSLLSEEAYAAGLRRIRTALEKAEAVGEQLIFPVELPIGMVVGRLGR